MKEYLKEAQEALDAIDLNHVRELQIKIDAIRSTGRTLFLAGNGGSFLIAQHWGVDLTKAARVKTHVLGSNPGMLTAYANDNTYHKSLSLELFTYARPGDMIVGLSVSGRSPNVLECMEAASKLRITPYLVSGLSCPAYSGIFDLRVPSTDYGIVEDAFSIIGHWLTKSLK